MANQMTMTPFLVPSLLLLALVLPTAGALVARLVARQSHRVMLIIGGVTAALAMASVIALQFLQVDQVALGRFAIFVPARAPLVDSQTFALVRPATALPTRAEPVAPGVALPATSQPTLAASTPVSPTPTPTPSAVATPLPTTVPSATATNSSVPATATPAPTKALVSTPTKRPTAIAQATATKKSTRRTYIVQKGDSLRSIATQFGVPVQALLDANGLTAKAGDNLQIDQTLIIPTH